MREKLERFVEAWAIDVTGWLWTGLCQEDVEKIWEPHQKHGSSIPEKDESEIYSQQLRRREKATGSRKEAKF